MHQSTPIIASYQDIIDHVYARRATTIRPTMTICPCCLGDGWDAQLAARVHIRAAMDKLRSPNQATEAMDELRAALDRLGGDAS